MDEDVAFFLRQPGKVGIGGSDGMRVQSDGVGKQIGEGFQIKNFVQAPGHLAARQVVITYVGFGPDKMKNPVVVPLRRVLAGDPDLVAQAVGNAVLSPGKLNVNLPVGVIVAQVFEYDGKLYRIPQPVELTEENLQYSTPRTPHSSQDRISRGSSS